MTDNYEGEWFFVDNRDKDKRNYLGNLTGLCKTTIEVSKYPRNRDIIKMTTDTCYSIYIPISTLQTIIDFNDKDIDNKIDGHIDYIQDYKNRNKENEEKLKSCKDEADILWYKKEILGNKRYIIQEEEKIKLLEKQKSK